MLLITLSFNQCLNILSLTTKLFTILLLTKKMVPSSISKYIQLYKFTNKTRVITYVLMFRYTRPRCENLEII